MNESDIRAKIAAGDAAKQRAKAIVELSEDLEDVVKAEAARVIGEEITRILRILDEAKQAIEAHPDKNPRALVLKCLGKMANRLTVISAGYAAGSLPQVKP
jgi:hypothetical protein